MSPLAYLPLLLAFLVLAITLISPFVPSLDRAFTRLSLDLFRNAVDRWGRKRSERIEQLQAIHATTTYTVYGAKTFLFSLAAGAFAFVLGIYGGLAGMSFLAAHREAVKSALPRELHFVIGSGPSLNPFGSLGGGGGATGGPGLPLSVPSWLVDFVPPQVVQTVAWLWSFVPDALRPSITGLGASSGGGGGSGDVEILIVFPDLDVAPDGLASLTPVQIALLLVGALLVGTIGAASTYTLRWYDIRSKAKERELLIEESFVRTVAFVYALSRSGMLFPEIMRTVSRNRQAFGETAEELSIGVKQMDLFGADVITALERSAKWTPSEQFAEFLKNFTNVLKSGQNVPDYLHDRYEQAQRERVENQEQLLEFFTALGEGYVALLVAGPLFLISILTIFGILNGGLYVLLQLMIYLAIPLTNLGFIAYLGNIGRTLSTIQVPDRGGDERLPIDATRSNRPDTSPEMAADGGEMSVQENLRRIQIYNRVRPLRWALKYPIETVTARPAVVLLLIVPIATAWLGFRWWLYPAGGVPATTLDDWLIQATLLVMVSFAIVYEIHDRRLRRIEAEVPDFLDSLASTNEAGRTFTESLKRLGATDFDVMGDEFDRLLTDIEWGARTEVALHRFSDRIGSPTVARVVALLTNALQASDQIGPVIRIAAEEARKDRSLKKKRRQEMFMYVLIVYISFVVFLGLTIALKTILVPAVPSADQLGGMASGGSFGIMIDPASGVPKDKYTLLLFHAAAVQGVFSGLVAGKMGEGSMKNGFKHAAIMLGAAYLVFTIFG